MISRNRVILTGKVATPPRCHYRPDGSPVIQFPLELNNLEDQSDDIPQHTGRGRSVNPIHTRQTGRSLIHIVAFGELAESKLDLLQSGLHLMVVGRLNQRQWQTPEGKKRTRTEVIAIDLQKVEVRHQTACLPTGKMDSIERGEEDEETC